MMITVLQKQFNKKDTILSLTKRDENTRVKFVDFIISFMLKLLPLYLTVFEGQCSSTAIKNVSGYKSVDKPKQLLRLINSRKTRHYKSMK